MSAGAGHCRSSWLGHQSWFVVRPAGSSGSGGCDYRVLALADTLTVGVSPVVVDSVGVQVVLATQSGQQAPVDDLGLVDREAVVVGRGQARRLADRAVDVGDGPARPADDVVVVVARPGPRSGRRSPDGWIRRTRPAVGEGAQHVVHGLVGDLAEVGADRCDDRLGVGVRMLAHRVEHGHPGPRHPQLRLPQQALVGLGRGHAGSMTGSSRCPGRWRRSPGARRSRAQDITAKIRSIRLSTRSSRYFRIRSRNGSPLRDTHQHRSLS